MKTGDRRPFISIRGLEKSYGPKRVLRGIDLDVHQGETLVVLGGSGEGKTVLLRHINGLEQADRGEVWVDGVCLGGMSEDELFEVRKKIGMVFQLGALFDSLTVYANISYPLREHGAREEGRMRERVREVLAMVGLAGVEHLYPAELSGGMKKRVALARAIALEPRAVLYDEPTSGLDPLVTRKINLMIRDLQQRLGFTSVVVTHDLKSALVVGDRFALLDQGRIRFTGNASQLRSTDDELMKEFVQSAL